MNTPVDLTRFAWLSITTGVVVFAMKLAAWAVTGSVGLLSDALESTVNIVAAVVALIALTAASKPADANHHFGHGKAEYFSSLAEGFMILLAAGLIIVSAVERLMNPRELEAVGMGVAISIATCFINGGVAYILIRAGRTHGSIVLTADGKHLLTDVWTSVGVVVAVGLIAVTGWYRLDPIIAIIVALNIVVAGVSLIRESGHGLMDSPLAEVDNEAISTVLAKHSSADVLFHQIQTRQAGRLKFAAMHVLVPGAWTVQRGHDVLEEVESDLKTAIPGLIILTHMEPQEDPRAWEDQHPGRADIPGQVFEPGTRAEGS